MFFVGKKLALNRREGRKQTQSINQLYRKLINTKQIAEQASKIYQQNEKRDEKQAQNVIKINQNDPIPRPVREDFIPL